MARSPAQTDRFANIASAEVTLSAANVLSFAEVLTGVSLGVGVGILIDEIDYTPDAVALQSLVANTDDIQMAWTTSTGVTDLADPSDRRILHAMRLVPSIIGSVVSLTLYKIPWVHQFFPPIIIAAPRIHFAGDSSGIATPPVYRSRLYYRYIELSTQEYLEIAETFQLTS